MARLHEYQGKGLLGKFKIAVPKGGVARTPQEARQIAEELGGEVMVKAQVWVTGRAGLGGIKKASNPAQAEEAARHMLGLRVKNFTVDQVLVEQRLDISREFYAGVIIDDAAQQPLIIFSSVGGTGIEEIAAEHPDRVARMHVDLGSGLLDFEARDLVRRTGIGGGCNWLWAASWSTSSAWPRSMTRARPRSTPWCSSATAAWWRPIAASRSTTMASFVTRTWASRSPASTTARPQSWKRSPTPSRPTTIAAPFTLSRWPRALPGVRAMSAFTAQEAVAR
jgi:hypothetical protein